MEMVIGYSSTDDVARYNIAQPTILELNLIYCVPVTPIVPLYT